MLEFNFNPANSLKDLMWNAFMDHGQKFSPDDLEQACWNVIRAATQKDAGQRGKIMNVDWKTLDMTFMDVVIEACALVLSDDWPEIKERFGKKC